MFILFWLVAVTYVASRVEGCVMRTGDGISGSYIWVGYLGKKACLETCIAKRKQDDSINGITMKSSGHDACWCHQGMKSLDKNHLYESCFLKPPQPKHELCTMYAGAGRGGDVIYAGAKWKPECAVECIKRKKFDKQIDGMTVGIKEQGCWCVKKMSYRNNDKEYRSCFLKESWQQRK